MKGGRNKAGGSLVEPSGGAGGGRGAGAGAPVASLVICSQAFSNWDTLDWISLDQRRFLRRRVAMPKVGLGAAVVGL